MVTFVEDGAKLRAVFLISTVFPAPSSRKAPLSVLIKFQCCSVATVHSHCLYSLVTKYFMFQIEYTFFVVIFCRIQNCTYSDRSTILAGCKDCLTPSGYKSEVKLKLSLP